MNLEQQILDFFLTHPGENFNARQLYAHHPTLKNDYTIEQIFTGMKSLAQSGELSEVSFSKFTLNTTNRTFEGVIEDIQSDFVVVWVKDLAENVLIPSTNQLLFIGDKVEVKITQIKPRYSMGELVKVIEETQRAFVGSIIRIDRQLFFIPDSKKAKWQYNLTGMVPSEYENQKAFAKFVKDTKGNLSLQIEKLLGPIGKHETEIHAIIQEFGLLTTFSDEALQESENLPTEITAEEIAKRRDFRDIWTITIDPYDAKDFDDALSLRFLENGHYEVGIHIADVSHYVKPNTALDREAYERATSVYLVDRTLPMLPEKISNFLCSLRPHEDKLSFSVVVELDANAHIVKEWFGRTVIHSDRRFTYEEVQLILEQGEGEYAKELKILNELAKNLRKKRMELGSINFETTEVKFQLDKDGKPLRVIPKIRKDAHKLIEEFMLLANQRVCAYVSKFPQIPMVHRAHDSPDPQKLLDLKNFLDYLGYQIDIGNERSFRRSLNTLVQEWEDSQNPMLNTLSSVAIRSMAKAVYQTKNVGHYALAFDFYTHFTSPIRRYPDVLVHRILAQVLEDKNKVLYSQEVLEKMAKHSSLMEKKATDAERASVRYKLVEYAQEHLETPYKGTVSGLANWGFYVILDDLFIEGMVPLKSLQDDNYKLIEKDFVIRGERTKKEIRYGDRVEVKIYRTDLQNRNIDLVLLKTEKYGRKMVTTEFLPKKKRNKEKQKPIKRKK